MGCRLLLWTLYTITNFLLFLGIACLNHHIASTKGERLGHRWSSTHRRERKRCEHYRIETDVTIIRVCCYSYIYFPNSHHSCSLYHYGCILSYCNHHCGCYNKFVLGTSVSQVVSLLHQVVPFLCSVFPLCGVVSPLASWLLQCCISSMCHSLSFVRRCPWPLQCLCAFF